MSQEYVVTRAKRGKEKQNPHGGTLVAWYVGLQSNTENHPDVYWQRKAESEVNVGDKVYGTVSKTEYGFRFKMDPKPSESPQNGGERVSGGFKDSARIERQHSQEMALRAVQIMNPPPTPGVEWQGVKWNVEPFRQMISDWTDWFVADLDNASPASTNPGSTRPGDAHTPVGARPPTPTGEPSDNRAANAVGSTPGAGGDLSTAEPRGFASDKQRDNFASPALQREGADVSICIPYLEQLPRADCRTRLDALGEHATRAGAAQKIQAEAEEWARNHSDVPADDTDLPSVDDALRDPALVGGGLADDEDIPF